MAKTIISIWNEKYTQVIRSFSELCKTRGFQACKVAEINCCGALHGALKKLPNLYYSEYGSNDPEIRSEDIMNLSYPDNFFDFVITSDVMEHLPDIEKSMIEISRVLKPGGFYVFTIPVLWGREKTRQRAKLVEGEIKHILPSSYHGSMQNISEDRIVFYEFGDDVLSYFSQDIFEMSVYVDDSNPSLTTFVAKHIKE